MTDRIYANPNQAANIIEQRWGTIETGESIQIDVVDGGQAVIDGIDRETMKERNLLKYSDYLFRFELESARLTLHFHERWVTEPLELFPIGTGKIDPQQATPPPELGTELGEYLEGICEQLDVFAWNLAEVSAASVAQGGYLTDYEFEYIVDCGALDPMASVTPLE